MLAPKPTPKHLPLAAPRTRTAELYAGSSCPLFPLMVIGALQVLIFRSEFMQGFSVLLRTQKCSFVTLLYAWSRSAKESQVLIECCRV